MAHLGDAVYKGGKWVARAPRFCPNGHRLEGGNVLVGHTACQGHGAGHLIWHCRQCPDDAEPTYAPPRGDHCTLLIGPAKIRNSFSGNHKD